MAKRAFDVSAALLGLFCLSPLFLLIAILVKRDSDGPVFFRQERIGKGFRPFQIYKFRTMLRNGPQLGGPITCGADPRVTRIGRVLRRTKIDELPQLINVLKGEMSIVGPRPEVRRYVEAYREVYEEVLIVRPGITDLASVKFCDEAALLGDYRNPEEMYLTRILPEKLKLGKEYVRRSSLIFDLTVVFKTLAVLIRARESL
jgi:lipopolysaccharide/colanic/teichoic acid biosynthesis glycosyltransferase